ncbi:MAG: L-aspartate oxidase [Thermodesulfobacteriota bacterium]
MIHETDVLVIGSGVAGLSFALKVARFARVTIVTKKDRVTSATNLAQGGVAAVLSREDSFALHVQDTLAAGAGLCHEDAVRMVVERGPACIRELMDIGVAFSVRDDEPDRLDLGREGGHSARRIVHARDLTGQEIERALVRATGEHPNITVLEDRLAVDLLIGSRAGVQPDDGRFGDVCLGAYVLDRLGGGIATYLARVTVLCTGGSGKVYLYTTNPDIATGDGIAMAWRAGARVANLEFMQFHPTCLYHPRAKNFLISEAVRGEGAILRDQRGQAFMAKYDPRRELATRDAVARAIDAEMKASGDDCVYLDISHRPAEFVRRRFPHIHATCLAYGIDITREPIPVVPAAHYMCGGVVTDLGGQTSLEGLYALGETACTGLHGGNRLASNSLLEAVVFADQAAARVEADWPRLSHRQLPAVVDWNPGPARRLEECILVNHNWDQIRRLMWNYVGIVRSDQRLALAHSRLAPISAEVASHYRSYLLTADLVELRNIALVAELIVRCAISRKESRGIHCNLDHPRPDDAAWRRDTVLHKGA